MDFASNVVSLPATFLAAPTSASPACRPSAVKLKPKEDPIPTSAAIAVVSSKMPIISPPAFPKIFVSFNCVIADVIDITIRGITIIFSNLT
ncbi:hypothetical protein SDC9_163693 [bioreactor metagenome]|uniref:Uncharacterized protein n=1 Tax=bioreactor metagenome TaxID=1076179 RepID=A0A645FWP4_9ZZZZ